MPADLQVSSIVPSERQTSHSDVAATSMSDRPSPSQSTTIGFAAVAGAGTPPPDWVTNPASVVPRRPVASSSRPVVPDIDKAMSVRPSELKSASSGSAELSNTACGESDVPRDANTCSRSVQFGVQPAAPPQPSTCTRSSRSPRPSPLKSAARSVERKRCDAVTKGCAEMRVPCDAVQSTASAAKLAVPPAVRFRRHEIERTGILHEDEVVESVAIDIDESRAARGRDVGDSCGRVRIRRARSLAQPLPGVSVSWHHDVTASVAVEIPRQCQGRCAVRSETRVEW